jgi:parvulin-like peptidyl-prolyl isomerase
MDALTKRLRAGEDFVELVRAGDDAVNDGDLGFFPIEGLYPAFRDAISTLEKGALTPVIEDEQGYHIFQLLDRSTSERYTLSEIAPQIKEAIRREEIGKRYRSWVDGLRERSYVEIRTRSS